MPDKTELAATTVETAELPTEAVAEAMDDAADQVQEAAVAAAEDGQDALATKLNAMAVTLRGELQHHVDEFHKEGASEGASKGDVQVVETETPEAVVAPRKKHWSESLPKGF